MGDKFFNKQDALRRLDNTICKYESVPYFIRYAYDETVELCLIADDKAPAIKQVLYTDPLFDYGFPGIGYVNFEGYAYYLERIPGRDQRVGLPVEMVKYIHGRVPNKLFRSKPMEQMLLNIYPTCKEAIRLIKDIGHSQAAVSRDYALERDEMGGIRVLYHDAEIATCKQEEGKYRVVYNQRVKGISFFMRHFGSKLEKDICGE